MLQNNLMCYKQHIFIIELDKALNTLWDLYLEKESKILKQKDYQNYTYQLQNHASIDNLTYFCIEHLKQIMVWKKEYIHPQSNFIFVID